MKSAHEEFINRFKKMNTEIQPPKSNYELLHFEDGSLREDGDWSQDDDDEMNKLLDEFCGIKEEER